MKRCPKCNSTNVKRTEDRSERVTHIDGLWFKKVWKCRDCGEILD